MTGKYIYGIIKKGNRNEFDIQGIGEKDQKVVTVRWQSLAAVVNNSPFKEYDSLEKEETIKDLILHQKVIEKVMEKETILPVQFGTMMKTEKQVKDILNRGYFQLTNTLQQIKDKIEVDLVATWNTPVVTKDIYQKSKKIQKQQEKIAKKGGGSLEEKILLGKMVTQGLEKRKKKYAQKISKVLKGEVIDFCPHEAFDPSVVFNGAYLLKKEKSAAFEEAVENLDKKFKNQLDFKLVGPLPPYSFATVKVRLIKEGEVKSARKVLGLSEDTDFDDLKKAHRALAKKTHPDYNPGQSNAEFESIDSSYKLLRKYFKNGLLSVEIIRLENI